MKRRIFPRTKTGLSFCLAGAAAVSLALSAPRLAAAEESRKPAWMDKAEFSFVSTGGNAQSSSLGIANTLTRTWARDQLRLTANVLRAHGTTVTRRAVGAAGGFAVVEDRAEQLVAENYALGALYDRSVSKRWTLNAGLSWDRNRFTGVASRLVAVLGGGTAWLDAERAKLRTAYGLTVTSRKYVSADRTSFVGFRATSDYERKLGPSAAVSGRLIFDEDFGDLADWRGEMVNSLSTAMSKRLALQVSVRWLYANRPAFEEIPLFGPDGSAAGSTVPVPLHKLDSFFTTSLCLNF